ncbi:unnamed protein product [Protopolystoma xenopodis]|uniref:Uncharacterized protein n=1 Tax=Protopolystoma xenopodis TaxID=117903 RepID=A0A448WC26_9PLAT|nr:unnamed protein product [Protopolystoma xenopodis]
MLAAYAIAAKPAPGHLLLTGDHLHNHTPSVGGRQNACGVLEVSVEEEEEEAAADSRDTDVVDRNGIDLLARRGDVVISEGYSFAQTTKGMVATNDPTSYEAPQSISQQQQRPLDRVQPPFVMAANGDEIQPTFQEIRRDLEKKK